MQEKYINSVVKRVRNREVLGSNPHTKDFKNGNLCDAPNIKILSKENKASAYVLGMRLTMLQIHLYQSWTMADMQLKKRWAPRPCLSTMCRQRSIY